jgi:Immunity protein 22
VTHDELTANQRLHLTAAAIRFSGFNLSPAAAAGERCRYPAGGDVAEEFEIVDVWVGRFPSSESADAYFEETYDDDDGPISQFAADMGESFFDHDFMERAFHDPPSDDFAKALASHSFSSSYLSAAVEAFELHPLTPFNLVLTVCNEEIGRPVSVSKPGVVLHYVGRFACDPKARPAE